MRATLVHNPTAGSGSPTTEELVEMLDAAGITAHPCSPKDKNLAKILAHPGDIVIAAGGDGTIAKVITRLTDREARVAILPLGTANNVARSFNITGPVEEVIAGWAAGREQKIDVGIASGPFEEHRFLEAVGLGALADTTAKKVKEEGSLAKQLERGRDLFRRTLRKAKPVKVKLMLDERPLKEEVLLLEIMNIGFVGPGLRLATEADPGDGRFDVVYVPADNCDDMLEWIEEPDRRAAPVQAQSARSITLHANGGSMLRIGDRSIPEAKGDVRIEIEHPSVTLLLPSPPKRKTVAAPSPQGGEDAAGKEA